MISYYNPQEVAPYSLTDGVISPRILESRFTDSSAFYPLLTAIPEVRSDESGTDFDNVIAELRQPQELNETEFKAFLEGVSLNHPFIIVLRHENNIPKCKKYRINTIIEPYQHYIGNLVDKRLAYISGSSNNRISHFSALILQPVKLNKPYLWKRDSKPLLDYSEKTFSFEGYQRFELNYYQIGDEKYLCLMIKGIDVASIGKQEMIIIIPIINISSDSEKDPRHIISRLALYREMRDLNIPLNTQADRAEEIPEQSKDELNLDSWKYSNEPDVVFKQQQENRRIKQ